MCLDLYLTAFNFYFRFLEVSWAYREDNRWSRAFMQHDKVKLCRCEEVFHKGSFKTLTSFPFTRWPCETETKWQSPFTDSSASCGGRSCFFFSWAWLTSWPEVFSCCRDQDWWFLRGIACSLHPRCLHLHERSRLLLLGQGTVWWLHGWVEKRIRLPRRATGEKHNGWCHVTKRSGIFGDAGSIAWCPSRTRAGLRELLQKGKSDTRVTLVLNYLFIISSNL